MDFATTSTIESSYALLPLWAAVLLLCTIGLALWSQPSSRPSLFLSVSFRASRQTPSEGHLLALNTRRATLITSSPLAKGDLIFLSLASLPGYSGDSTPIEAQVQSCRTVAGDRDDFVTELHFRSLEDGLRSALARYVTDLSPQPNWSHA